MGLRFHKSISLFPGVKLNVSKSGVGVSAGVPGLRGSINTSGRVTGTVGIPGTGVSYVKTKTLGKKSKSKAKDTEKEKTKAKSTKAISEKAETAKSTRKSEVSSKALPSKKTASVQIDANAVKMIHSVSDTAIDWNKVVDSPTPPDASFNPRTWAYYYSIAPDVLAGDIDTYLKLIYDVNPLDDLLDYGTNFEFGTDRGDKIEVEFVINDAVLSDARGSLSTQDYHILLQDFVCSMSLRIARDMFALLPVKNTVVHTVLDGETIFSVDFDRTNLSKINFDYIDASNTATLFRNNMKFDAKKGFSPVNPL